jgi:hypothetical protein
MANYSDVKASGAIVKSYANFAAFPSSGNSAGDLVLALDTGGIYVWDGSEWDRVASGADELPEFTTEPAASYELESDGTATIITVAATDPEGFPITYSHDTVPSNQAQATITNSGGTFTVTPSTNTANAGTFTLRLKASDGVNVSSKSSLLNLVFATNEVDISPALNSATTLNRADGNITGFATNTVYTLTNNSTRAIVFDWTLNGAGGGHSSGGAGGGAGGQTTGRWSLAGNGGTVNLLVGSKGARPTSTEASRNGAGGGAGTGIFTGTYGSDTPILVAGGGGGAGHASQAAGAGGGTSGGDGSSANQNSPARGGTQSGPGAGASGSRGSGDAGSGHNGGDGGGGIYVNSAGGQGYGNGGRGEYRGGDGGGGGGGGGYYGGGGGGVGNYGAGSGGAGASGYIGGSGVTNGVTTAGAGSAAEVDGSITIAWVDE